MMNHAVIIVLTLTAYRNSQLVFLCLEPTQPINTFVGLREIQ